MLRFQETRTKEMPLIKIEVDKEFSSQLSKYEVPSTLFNGPRTTIVAGAPGSGKTTNVLSMLQTYGRGVFDEKFLIVPETSIHSIRSNAVIRSIPRNHIFPQMTGSLPEIERRVKALALKLKRKPRVLLLADDVQDEMKNKENQKALLKFAQQLRHLGVCLILLVQNVVQVPKDVRRLVHNFMLFPSGYSHDVLEEQHKEALSDLDREVFHAVMQAAKREGRNSFVLYDKPGNKLYLDFSRVFAPAGVLGGLPPKNDDQFDDYYTSSSDSESD